MMSIDANIRASRKLRANAKPHRLLKFPVQGNYDRWLVANSRITKEGDIPYGN